MNIKNTLLALSLFLAFQTQAQTSYTIPDGKNEDVGYLTFKENLGQVQNDSLDSVPEVKFYCTQQETKFWLLENGQLVFSTLKQGVDTMPDTSYSILMQPQWEGSPITGNSALVAEDATGVVSHYYLSHCGPNGIEDVEHYQRITWPNIYNNIHQQVYSNNTGIKYYYIVEPGGNPNHINIKFTGQDQMTVSPSKMNFYLGQMQVTLDNAIAYEIDNLNQVTPSSWTPTFVNQGNGSITLSTGTYNTNNTLVIQIGAASLPAVTAASPGSMEYSSYLTADKNDQIEKVLTNGNGDIFMLGESTSSSFPLGQGTQVALQKGQGDVVVFRFDAGMEPKVYTYFGTSAGDIATSMALDNSGKVYIAGQASGNSLPGGINVRPASMPYASGYIAKLDAVTLKLDNSFWFGSDGTTTINDMEIDNNNKLVIVGESQVVLGNLPVKNIGGSAYYQSTNHTSAGGKDGFVARLTTSYSIEHCTWFGSDGQDGFHKLSLDNSGNIYALMHTTNTGVTPIPSIGCGVTTNKSLPKCIGLGGYFTENNQGADDYYLAQFYPNFRLVWGTWIGGPKSEQGNGTPEMAIVVDKNNPTNLYLALTTENPVNFSKSSAASGYIVNRTTDNNRNVMVLKFVSGVLSWHTSLGCTGNSTNGLTLEMDDKQNVFVGGKTTCRYIPLPGGWCQVPGQSQLFPMCDNGVNLFVQSNQYLNSQSIPSVLGFITTFDKNNELKWSTWFGGDNTDIINSLHFNSSQKRMYSVGYSTSATAPIPLRNLLTSGSHYQPALASATGGMVAWFSSDLNFVSVQEIESSHWKVNAYPNPTNSWLHVDMEGEANYQLYDISGRLLQSGRFTKDVNAISTETLDTGSYLLRMQQGGKLATVKFVKE